MLTMVDWRTFTISTLPSISVWTDTSASYAMEKFTVEIRLSSILKECKFYHPNCHVTNGVSFALCIL